MEIENIKELIKLFDSSKLGSLDFEYKDIKLRLKKEITMISKDIDKQNGVETTAINEEISIDNQKDYSSINSPIVGVYYDTPSPKASVFVNVGDYVKKGQVVCIVEAMKVMNEITSPYTGKVIEKCVNNEDVVAYEQPLLLIEV